MDFDPIPLRYDGLDAANHEIDLSLLGQSLQGAARILAVAGHFAVTHRYARKLPTLAVRVLAKEPRVGCYEVTAHLLHTGPLVLPLVHRAGTKLVEATIKYVVSRLSGRHSEMSKALDVMEACIKEQGDTSRAAIEAMRSVAEKLADGQRSAAKMLVAPVGATCATLRIGANENDGIEIDKATRDAIDAPEPVEIVPERTYNVLISEMDLETRSCKLTFQDGFDPDSRYVGEITDPIIVAPNNPYVSAMAARTWLPVKGKAQLKEGELDKLYISDTAA